MRGRSGWTRRHRLRARLGNHRLRSRTLAVESALACCQPMSDVRIPVACTTNTDRGRIVDTRRVTSTFEVERCHGAQIEGSRLRVTAACTSCHSKYCALVSLCVIQRTSRRQCAFVMSTLGKLPGGHRSRWASHRRQDPATGHGAAKIIARIYTAGRWDRFAVNEGIVQAAVVDDHRGVHGGLSERERVHR